MQTRLHQRCRQQGLTLIELMIAITLTLLVTLAGVSILVASSSSYRDQNDIMQMQDSGRFAIDLIARIIRQADYENYQPAVDRATNSQVLQSAAAFFLSNGIQLTPAISGANNASEPGRAGPFGANGEGSGVANSHSDTIQVRYFGVNAPDPNPLNPPRGDGSVINCGGVATAAPTSLANAEVERGTSIFYVAREKGTNEPALHCRFQDGNGRWQNEPLVRGVENLQFLYGLDTDPANVAPPNPAAEGRSYPNQFVPANEITSDAQWRQVVAVRVSLIVRSANATNIIDPNERLNLFGAGYNNAADPGTVIRVGTLPSVDQARARKMYSVTVFLNNQNGAL